MEIDSRIIQSKINDITEVFIKTEAVHPYQLTIRTNNSSIASSGKSGYTSVYSEEYPRSVFYNKSRKVDKKASKLERFKNLFGRKKVSDTKLQCENVVQENIAKTRKITGCENICDVKLRSSVRPLGNSSLFNSKNGAKVKVKSTETFVPHRLTSVSDKVYKVRSTTNSSKSACVATVFILLKPQKKF